MRRACPIVLTEEERSVLVTWSRGRRVPVRLAERATIILHAATGMENTDIAAAMGTNRTKVGRWRTRFASQRLTGIEKDAPRGGRPAKKRARLIERIIEKTTKNVPEDATHWSARSLAKELGTNSTLVHRVWKASGLKPHLVHTFKISNDAAFVEKLTDVVGLYINPPEHALVLCADEKSQIQALDRTQPGLPLKKGRCGTMTHDYKRHGTTTLFAALELAEGQLIGACMDRHRHQEWIKFLKIIDERTQKDKELHLIVDNYATHKHPKVKAWLKRHKRFHIHFIPTSSSWLNLIERWFRDLTNKRIRRGVFRNVDELIEAISTYIERYNADAKPFVWTASAEHILGKVRRAKATLDKIRTE